MSQLPGIAQVIVGGQQKPAVRVQVDPAKLAAVGLQLEDVANVITTATVNAPQGRDQRPARSNYTIYDNDQLLKAAPWNDVVVAYKNGAPIRIRDIGVAVDGPENNQLRRLGRTASTGILLLIYKQPGANVIDAVQRVEGAAAARHGVGAAVDQGRPGDRPHHHHQGLGAGRRVHAAARRSSWW